MKPYGNTTSRVCQCCVIPSKTVIKKLARQAGKKTIRKEIEREYVQVMFGRVNG